MVSSERGAMRNHRVNLTGLLLTLLIVLGSAAQGFAYRYSRPITDPALLAWLQTGGTLGDLCSGGAEHRGIPCDGALTGPAVLPAPVRMPRPAGWRLSRAPRFAALVLAPLAPRDPAHGVRGPPVG